MSLPKIHRVVTGHTPDGKAVISSDGPLSTVFEFKQFPDVWFHEVWETAATPVIIDNCEDPTIGPVRLSPPANGTRIRFVDIPPDTEEYLANSAEKMQAGFAEIGESHASTAASGNAPHPVMHRTQTVDYGVVIEGKITLILDDSEVDLEPGSVVIQRGTNHGWANRSDKPCRMLFVLVDGVYSEEFSLPK
jgi:mannose-6-phosphate isomerase-like protein (cupin superfamily)